MLHKNITNYQTFTTTQTSKRILADFYALVSELISHLYHYAPTTAHDRTRVLTNRTLKISIKLNRQLCVSLSFVYKIL